MAHNFILSRLGRVLNVDAAGTPMFTKQINSLTATVGSNALTITLDPTVLEFRSTTLSTGTPITRIVPSAITLTVPSGATLGTTNGVMYRLIVLAIDNAGTVELAIVNSQADFTLDETSLISTTIMNTASDLATTIYSTTARTNVAFRVVGIIDSTQATAGTWATTPSLVQGTGGQADFNLFANSMVGQIGFFTTSNANPGWLKANGAAVSRTTYSRLYARIGTTYGAGDGSTTFNVPDLRGLFPRCWDDGRGVYDPSRALGSVQDSANISHNHPITSTVTDPGHFHYSGINLYNPGGGDNSNYGSNTGTAIYTGSATTGISVSSSSSNSGTTESRPWNMSLLACIKY